MTRDDNRSHGKAVCWRSAPTIIIAIGAALAIACRGPKPSADQTYVPVPVNPPPVARSVRPLPPEAFRVEWIGHDVPPVMKAGASSTVTVTLKNISIAPWPDPDSTSQEPPEAGAVRLAYRWWAGSSPSPLPWGRRADLVRLLQPGQVGTLQISVTAPPAPGGYRLQFDLVQEMFAYFQDKGAATMFVPVQVQ